MKVWIVIASPYHDNDTILGAYDSKGLAEAWAAWFRLLQSDLSQQITAAIKDQTPQPDDPMNLYYAEAVEVEEIEVSNVWPVER